MDKFLILLSIGIFVLEVLLIVSLITLFVSCTISFQNISTHGTATDLVDEEMTISPDIKTDLTIPFNSGVG